MQLHAPRRPLEEAPRGPSGAVAAPTGESTESTFSSVFHAHFGYVWATLRRCGVRPGDLEDVTHEVFFRVYRQWSAYDHARPVRPWLFGFAYRVAKEYGKLSHRRFEVSGVAVEAADKAPLADEQLVTRDAHALLEHALGDLDLDHRAVVLLHDLEEQPAAEIAATLGVPLFTVYSRLRVGRQRMARTVRRLRAARGER